MVNSVRGEEPMKVAVVIPCYRVRRHIANVLTRMGKEVSLIYVVDDKCPEETGKFVEDNCHDPRIKVLWHETNAGVGAATITGYREALSDGAEIIVKLDGDGQMDPGLISQLIHPIVTHEADYAKGNRFYHPRELGKMPFVRLVGNVFLSLFSKCSSGYWNLIDPTNGFTAIHATIVPMLPLEKIAERYFFESDLLFHLNIIRAVVSDVPMAVSYGSEKSNVNIAKVTSDFFVRHFVNAVRRIFYNYFLRDFNVASLELFFGLILLLFGISKGASFWYTSWQVGTFTSSGKVMLAALPIIIGMQLLLAFLSYDVQNLPQKVLHQNALPEQIARKEEALIKAGVPIE